MQRVNVANEFKDLAFDFFFHFSRFEYALKANGFLKSAAFGSNADANWDACVKKFEGSYSPGTDALELTELAPKKQIVGRDRQLGWADVGFGASASELEKVSRHLRTTRNNLFHGGKNGGGGWDDSARNINIVSAGTKVLFSLAELGKLMNDFNCEY